MLTSSGGDQPAASSSGPVQDFSLEPFKELVKNKKFHCTMCGKCCTGSGEVGGCEICT